MSKDICLALLLALPAGTLCAQGQLPAAPEARPQDIQGGERAAIKDKILTSLSYRGELADKINDAGMAATLVDTEGAETYSDIRLLLLEWIKRNPDQAAGLALHFANGGGAVPRTIMTVETSWNINSNFLAKIKALKAAAGDASSSSEDLELAARRLYEGSPSDPEAPAITGNSRGAGTGSGFFSGSYADYKLNRAGLDRELSGAGAMLETLRGPEGHGPPGAEPAYGAAVGAYGSFVVAASAVKGRAVISANESSGLEANRAALRRSLAALSLKAMSVGAGDMARGLSGPGSAPAGVGMAAGAAALRAELDEAAARAADPATGMKDLRGIMGSAEKGYYGLYLRYSVYTSAQALGARARGQGFSCLYDYLLWRWLAFYCPQAGGARTRAGLAAAASAMDGVLAEAAAGDLEAALAGGGPGSYAASVETARSFSAFNRAAQFFSWGIVFRPVEVEVKMANGRISMRPSVTFYKVLDGMLAPRVRP